MREAKPNNDKTAKTMTVATTTTKRQRQIHRTLGMFGGHQRGNNGATADFTASADTVVSETIAGQVIAAHLQSPAQVCTHDTDT